MISSGFETFCDIVDDPNFQLQNDIYNKIRKCEKFIFLHTGVSNQNLKNKDSWIYKEILFAQKVKKEIISITLKDTFKNSDKSNLNSFLKARITLYGSFNNLRLNQSSFLDLLNSSHESNINRYKNFVLNVVYKDFKPFLENSAKSMGYEQQIINTILSKINITESSSFKIETINERINTLKDKIEYIICKRALLSFILINNSRNKYPIDAKLIRDLTIQSIFANDVFTNTYRISSQGFIVIPLFLTKKNGMIWEHLRLHIWSPNLQVKRNLEYQIHSHQTFAQSWILCGETLNTNYHIQDTKESESSIFNISWDKTEEYSAEHKYSIIKNTGKKIEVRQIDKVIFTENDSYKINAGEYHSTENLGNELTATLFLFDASQGMEINAGVIGPSSNSEEIVSKNKNHIEIKNILKQLSINIGNNYH